MAKEAKNIVQMPSNENVECPICGVSMESKKSVVKGRWALSFVCVQPTHKVEVKLYLEEPTTDGKTEGEDGS